MGLTEQYGYDFSLEEDIKYFVAFRDISENGTFVLREAPDKVIPLEKGLFVDVLLEGD